MTVAEESANQQRGDITRLQDTEAWQDLARHDQAAAQADVRAESDHSACPHTHNGSGRRASE